MLRPLARLPARSAPAHLLRAGQRHQRRCIGSAPPPKRPRSFRSSIARWGLAGGAIYWYTNSDLKLFDQQANEHGYIGTEIYDVPQEVNLPTLETIAESRRQRQSASLSASPAGSHTDVAKAPSSSSQQQSFSRDDSTSSPSSSTAAQSSSVPPIAPSSDASQSNPMALEEEAQGEGAFNEETGEINWDCPCLGGMAHGPCGDQFREAFSCFVYSKEEPKGYDCIDRFKNMQDCFRLHPDVYGSELTDDMDEETEAALNSEAALDSGAAPQAGAAQPADAPYSGSKTQAAETPSHNLTANPPATPSGASISAPTSTTPPSAAASAGQKIGEAATSSSSETPTTPSLPAGTSGSKVNELRKPHESDGDEQGRTERAKAARQQVQRDHADSYGKEGHSESEAVVPKASHDTTWMNEGK